MKKKNKKINLENTVGRGYYPPTLVLPLPTRQSSAPCTLPRSCRWCCAGLHLYRRCKAAAYQHHSSCRGRSSSAESSVPLNQCQSRSLHGNQPLFVKVEECILMTETLEQNFQTAAVSIKGGSRGDTANEKDATWVTSPTAIYSSGSFQKKRKK